MKRTRKTDTEVKSHLDHRSVYTSDSDDLMCVTQVNGQVGGQVHSTWLKTSTMPLAPSPVGPLISLGNLEVRGGGVDEFPDEVQSMDVSPIAKEDLVSIPEFSPVNEVTPIGTSNARALEDLMDLTGQVGYPKTSPAVPLGDSAVCTSALGAMAERPPGCPCAQAAMKETPRLPLCPSSDERDPQVAALPQRRVRSVHDELMMDLSNGQSPSGLVLCLTLALKSHHRTYFITSSSPILLITSLSISPSSSSVSSCFMLDRMCISSWLSGYPSILSSPPPLLSGLGVGATPGQAAWSISDSVFMFSSEEDRLQKALKSLINQEQTGSSESVLSVESSATLQIRTKEGGDEHSLKEGRNGEEGGREGK
ncbi:hypothetical protein JZ751_016576 [Albula glossodonta]|uniref:Uncharacterized protein n=1 Tax=Albula glossodonta TaxID=121402 RepID=A0A8T2MV81_9TELE|nr:hypothetical protein JZ751_016576 [Albula glossodonta]